MAALLQRSGRKLYKLLPQASRLATNLRRNVKCDIPAYVQPSKLDSIGTRCLTTCSVNCQQFPPRLNATQQDNDFRRILKRLDDAVRTTGRITQNQLTVVFDEVCKMEVSTANQALLLIRSCGSLLPEMTFTKRTELAHEIWQKLADMGTVYDVSHYNALLRVYLQNEHAFSPTDFLANLEAKGIEPNRVTYQRLIAAYCQKGDIQGATKILEFMKSKDLPVTEGVFNSLIEGHSRVEDMESAKGILDVMRNVGLEPSFETYSKLLCAYAAKGDIATINSTLEQIKTTSVDIPDKVFLGIVDQLACNGFQEEVPQMLENVRFIGGCLQEAINLIIALITKGHEESAFAIVRLFKTLTNDSLAPGQYTNRCNFLIDHFIHMKMPLDKFWKQIDELEELGLHQSPYLLALQCSLRRGEGYKDYSLSILQKMHEKEIPLKSLYFYPLMALEANKNNNAGILKLFKMAVEMKAVLANEMYKMYVLPAIQGSSTEIIQQLTDHGAALDNLLLTAVCRQESMKGRLEAVFNIVQQHPGLEIGGFRSNINEGFIKNPDVDSMFKIFQHNLSHFETGEVMSKSEYTGMILANLLNAVPQDEADRMRPHLELLLNHIADDGQLISTHKFRRIRSLLEQLKLGGLKATVQRLVDPDDVTLTPSGRIDWLSADVENIDKLESNLQELKEKGGNCRSVLRRLIEACCETNQPEKALEYKAQWDNIGYGAAAGVLSRLVGVCASNKMSAEANKLRNELSASFPNFKLDMLKYTALIEGAVRENKLQVALDLVDEIKEHGTNSDNVERHVFFILHHLASDGFLEEAKELTCKFIDNNIVNSNNNILRPIVAALMEKRDMEGALAWIQDCQVKYGFMPSFHDILVHLIQDGDKEMLEKAMEFSSSHHGDINMLYDMTFAFLTTGKYDEAKKIIDTPGMVARGGRLQWYTEKCIAEKMQENLEKLIEITQDLYNCNRDNLYFALMQLHTRNEDVDKCLQVWISMQDEEVIPSDRTLRYLANVLQSHNRAVPFEVPKIAEKISANISMFNDAGDDQAIIRMSLTGNLEDTLKLIKDAIDNNTDLRYKTLEAVLMSSLHKGQIDTALKVKNIAENIGMTISNAGNNAIFLYYVDSGDLAAAEAMYQDLLNKGIEPTVKMVRVLALKHEQNNDLEKIYRMKQDLGDVDDHRYHLFKYILGTLLRRKELDVAFKEIEELMKGSQEINTDKVGLRSFFTKMIHSELPMDKAHDFTDKMIAEGNDIGTWKLLCAYMDSNNAEEAQKLINKYPVLMDKPERIVGYTIQCARNDADSAVKIQNLLEITKGTQFSDRSKLYFYLIKAYDDNGNFEGALRCREEMLNEGIEISEFNLKRIALLLKRKNQDVPFAEPEKSLTHYREELKSMDKEIPLEILADHV